MYSKLAPHELESLFDKVPRDSTWKPMGVAETIERNIVLMKEGQSQLPKQGRELWAELHTSVTFATLSQWEVKIPNFACGCRKFYDSWVRSNPPRAADFFSWTVDLHNAVNAKLGKPTLTLDDARKIWMV